ncbi:MAG TPA: CPBP family intramembrane glutamic endopeptidase [Candidatus Deferrimicrobiaceae bacterium]|nr:CPBP family intramembrane glutamic endopeptidase [Candidatus Deferrimicrobiaceae bacterium]
MTEPLEGPTRAPAGPPAAPGLFRFVTEGRRAPGLFVVGWLATIVGLAPISVAALSQDAVSRSIFGVLGLAVLAVGLLLLAGSQAIERRAAGVPYAGPSPVLVLGIVYCVANVAAYVVGTGLQLSGVSPDRPVIELVLILIQAAAFLGVVRLVVVGPGALGWSDMGIRGDLRAISAGLLGGVLFAGPVILVTTIVGLLAITIAGATPPSPLPPTGTPAGLALHFVAGGLIAPIYEEIRFRGVALSAWLRSVDPATAIVRSSLLFVLVHLMAIGADTAGEAAAMAFVAAIVRLPVAFALGWLYVRTGTLWAPIGLHMAFNTVLIAIGETAASSAAA